ncbi:SLBB domain-containing protein [Chromobacterium alticapitis]|uniref:Sugar ABC transporter substrate-binding protein n=1 Tax=Chromobacterium alticapitis TaxID=2073169 RepID=A0A2S5DGR8_9NEIS|nr:SLBB domain-containing protein [Chromobacterium alticapitis]POZ62207.1 sugar ABC transporter substrate-binding protein [Chromobacterium alticapitis]
MKNKTVRFKPLLIGVLLASAMLAQAAPSNAMPDDAQSSSSGLPIISGGNTPTASQQAPRQLTLTPLPPLPPLPFADFIRDSTNLSLQLFGQALFQSQASRFETSNSVAVNPDYVIGTGDQLQIKGWGMVDIDLDLTVDRKGEIYLPRVGAVSVAGVRYRDLQSVLKKSIGRVFNNFDLSVSLLQSRSVQVYIVGHARSPGSYTMSAMSTLLNGLLLSGGPNNSGSVRQVNLIRDGKQVTTLDLYDVLVKGDKSLDQTLRDGDTIQIPAAGPRLALIGDIKTPAIYEFKPGETVADLMHWAGGLESAAEGKQVLLEKNVDHRFVQQATLKGDLQALRDIPLNAGDILRLQAPGARAINVLPNQEFVTISGETNQTGTYTIRRNETLRQFVMRLGGVSDDAYIFGTMLTRSSVRQSQQQKLDEAADRFEKDLDQNASTRIAQLTDKDSIAAVNNQTEKQHQLAARIRSIKADGRIVLELKDMDAQVKDLPDVPLQDGDMINIPRRPSTVSVIGSVYQANTFIFRPQRSVSDYVTLAGGLSPSGDESAMYLLRADGTAVGNGSWLSSVGGKRINPGDTIVVPEKLERSSWTQSLKEWTSILYQFGLGAAGLKVLK